MNRPIEDRLRAAYQAKAEQVTDERLTQLRAEHEERLTTLLSDDADVTRLDSEVLHPWFGAPGRTARHSRWLPPALAAAVVVAVAAGALAVANSHGPQQPRPAPPASHVSSPTSASTPTPSAARSTSASQPSATATNAAPPYLARGKTGTRTDIPWSVVGSGWRLLQPSDDTGPTSKLYLYDPAGGRYLITDQLPHQAWLVAWSPDGQRAMLATYGDGYTRYQQIDLSSGKLQAGFLQYLGNFVGYTQPRGLAVLVHAQVQGAQRLLRYGTDGTLQLEYPPQVGGLSLRDGFPLYIADGSQFVAGAGKYSVLLSNGGQLVRQYALPRPEDQSCRPVKWWTSDTFLEACERQGPTGAFTALYLQPVAGGATTALVEKNSKTGMGYGYAWQLSNGDVLLSLSSGCGSAGYDILHPDGSTAALTLPAGVPAPGTITNMTGDLATFRVVHGCGNPGPNVSLIDYNMVTGATTTLIHSNGILLSYPGDK
jgi:hypothetical protein